MQLPAPQICGNRIMKILATAAALLAAATLCATGLQAQNGLQQYIDGKMKRDPRLSRCITAVYVCGLDGSGTAGWNSSYPMVPASTMKLVTTGTALKALSGSFRYRTRLACSGQVRDGVLLGDLYIIGGGDPTLGTRDSVLAVWTEAVAQAGIDSIAGAVIGDARYFPEASDVPSWQWSDLGAYYGSGACGLSFAQNMIRVGITPGSAPGERAHIRSVSPETPWIDIDNQVVTTGPGSASKVEMFTSPLAPRAVLTGSIAADRRTMTKDCSNKYPALTCAWMLDRRLQQAGINSRLGAIDASGPYTGGYHPTSGMTDTLCLIAETLSPCLAEIAAETNHESNNMYAETLFRTTGLMTAGSSSYEASAKAVKAILKEMGADVSAYAQEDGSGLSRNDLISPEALCGFLAAMSREECFPEFLSSLPSPGTEGTLKYVLKGVSPQEASRISAKSGSMTGIKCYAGYVRSKSSGKRYAFAIMTNGNTGRGSEIQPAIEGFLKALLSL